MKVSWDDEIPSIWKWQVIKFHGSKPPTSIVGPRPLEGRGVLYTSGGWGGVGGWGGACNNVQCELAEEGHACLWLPVGACMHGWSGVGWGRACNNVHVNLRRKDMLLCGYCKFSGTFHSCVMPRYVSSLELSTHTSCYVTVSSLELSTHTSRYVTVSSLELSTHASCYVTVSSLELSTHASCHAIVSSLGRTRSVAVTNTGIKTCQVEYFENSHKPQK